MRNRRSLAVLAGFALLTLAACGGGDEVENADVVTTDTITESAVEMVEVPVQTTDTAVVQTEVQIDTMVEVDTIQNP